MARPTCSTCARFCFTIVFVNAYTCSSKNVSLRRDRVQVCRGIGYAHDSKGLASFVGSFRTNPLPEVLLPRADTVSTQRLQSLQDYAWTLLPYLFVSGVLIAILLLACPCCCCFICLSKSTNRSPSIRVTGIAYNLALGLISLVVLIAVTVAVEEQSNSNFAYSQAKCAVYTTIDTLVNGVPVSDQTVGGASTFVGLRNLLAALSSSSISFPNVTKRVQSIQKAFTKDTIDVPYVDLAQGYYASWKKSHQTAMQGTAFRCSLCKDEPLQLLLNSVSDYKNATSILKSIFRQAKTDMGGAGQIFETMSLDVLNDIKALYSLCFIYGGRLQDFIPLWERWQMVCARIFQLLVVGTLVCIALGLLATFFCKSETFAFVTWWFTYFHTIALLGLFAVLFATTVAVHDFAGVLRSVVTQPGIETYRLSLFPTLSAWQGSVLGSCINKGGDLRKQLNFSVSVSQMQQWKTLDLSLAAARQARLDESNLALFFARYSRIDGGTYHAGWNVSQTLAWHSEGTGLLNIAERLRRLSGERWTFHNAQPPVGCAMALPFKPSRSVLGWSCFFVTPTHPTSAEVKERYQTLNIVQLKKLQDTFQKARIAALALQLVQNFAKTNQRTASDLKVAWHSSAQIVNKALADSLSDIGKPLQLFSSRVSALNNGGDCASIRSSYLAATELMGQNYVAAHLVLTACSGVLAICSVGLTLLYCMLWSIRQEGREHRFVLVASDLSDFEDEPGSGDSMSDEMELELRTPLTQSW